MTVDKHTHELARPFLVLATQNPIEYEGTYPLPEAQLDRFMVRVSLGYPSAEQESDMLLDHAERDRVLDLEPVTDVGEVLAAQAAAGAVHGSEALRRYIVAILDATRADPRVELGASPRAGLMLFRAAKALAALDGRDHALPDDVQKLARHGAEPPPAARARARAATSGRRWCATRWSGSPRSEAEAGPDPADRHGAARDWRCASPGRTFDSASLYVPGVGLIVLAVAAIGWVALAAQGRDDHAPAGAAHGRGGRARTRCGWRCAPGALPAAGRRVARAAARLARADRRAAGPGGCGSTSASRAAGAGCSSPVGW